MLDVRGHVLAAESIGIYITSSHIFRTCYAKCHENFRQDWFQA